LQVGAKNAGDTHEVKKGGKKRIGPTEKGRRKVYTYSSIMSKKAAK